MDFSKTTDRPAQSAVTDEQANPSVESPHNAATKFPPHPQESLTAASGAAKAFLDSVPIQIADAGLHGFFGGPIDMSQAQPPAVAPKDMCATMPPSADLKAAITSANTGNSALHRVYEAAVQTPPGTHLAKDFPNIYGAVGAQKLQDYGITQISKAGTHADVLLKAPISVTEGGTSLIIAKALGFDSIINGVTADVKSIKGVTASSGWLSAYVNTAKLVPRENGYISATVTASLSPSFAPSFGLISQTRELCAHPDGKIYQ